MQSLLRQFVTNRGGRNRRKLPVRWERGGHTLAIWLRVAYLTVNTPFIVG